MGYSRRERRIAPVDDESIKSEFTVALDERVTHHARECERGESDVGTIATVLLVTGAFLGLLTYLGMYGP